MTRVLASLPKLIFGVLVVLAGVALTLHNLGYFEIRPYLKFWPVILIVLGLVRLANRCWWGAVVWTGVGVFLLADNLDWFNVNIFAFWPLFLVLLGVSIARRALFGPAPGRGVASAADPVVSSFAIMSGLERRNDSPAFRGGDVTAIMGGCALDLRDAKIEGDAADIEIFAFWGGIELIVPEGWSVESRVVPLLGGFEDKTAAAGGALAPVTGRLVVRGFVIMGGAEVKNEKSAPRRHGHRLNED
jgi:hypothetical protein